MNDWKLILKEKIDISNSILIVGLPGIANVGKIVCDFLIEELKAKKVAEFSSYNMPNSVFVNENNLIEMPKIEMFFVEIENKNNKNNNKKEKNKILILTGDSQPVDEVSCYSFCDSVLDYFVDNKGDYIITLGGIGLQNIPKNPKVYITGNNKEKIEEFSKNLENLRKDVYGIVGPIIGVSGLLLGLAEKRNINGICLLGETFGHPMYVGLKSAKNILNILEKKFALNLNMKNLDNEIKAFESKLKIADELIKAGKNKKEDVSYIG
ncbi:MAG: PAC2 family protein [Candidatus Woesearchaeota archaeon]